MPRQARAARVPAPKATRAAAGNKAGEKAAAKPAPTPAKTAPAPKPAVAGLPAPVPFPTAAGAGRASATVKPHAVDLKDYKDGSFKMIEGGEVFQLQVVKDDPMGRTHKLKNEEHFWEGNEAEFRATFEKK